MSEPQIILCPGQGAQAVSMGKGWFEASPEARATFELADRLLNIQYHFRTLYNAWSDPAFAMEVEFKITKDNKLFIKQARPWVE